MYDDLAYINELQLHGFHNVLKRTVFHARRHDKAGQGYWVTVEVHEGQSHNDERFYVEAEAHGKRIKGKVSQTLDAALKSVEWTELEP